MAQAPKPSGTPAEILEDEESGDRFEKLTKDLLSVTKRELDEARKDR